MKHGNRTHLLFMLFLVVTMFLAACGSLSEQESVVGKWTKVTSGICDLPYPSEVEFFKNGTYMGALPSWRSGQYSVLESNRLQLETTTGMGVYNFSISEDAMIFRSDSNCEFKYRRVKP